MLADVEGTDRATPSHRSISSEPRRVRLRFTHRQDALGPELPILPEEDRHLDVPTGHLTATAEHAPHFFGHVVVTVAVVGERTLGEAVVVDPVHLAGLAVLAELLDDPHVVHGSEQVLVQGRQGVPDGVVDEAGHDDSLKMEDGEPEGPGMGEAEALAHPPSLLGRTSDRYYGGSVRAWRSARLLRLLSGLPDHDYSLSGLSVIRIKYIIAKYE